MSTSKVIKMLREDYSGIWKSLLLEMDSVEKIQSVIENKCFQDSLFSPTRDDMVIEGVIDTFNDLHWFLEGDGDCKDMFYDENDFAVPINDTIKFPDLLIDDSINRRVSNFVESVKEHLTPAQLGRFIDAIEQLYVFDVNYLKNKFYLKNDYQLGKLKTKQKIITSLLKIR